MLRARRAPRRAGHRRAARLRAARRARRRRRGVPRHAADARRPDLRRRAVARRCSEALGGRASGPPTCPTTSSPTSPSTRWPTRRRGREPAIRWLLSTVPTTMVFDDHEIHAEWRISQGWLDEMNAEPWFDRHIRAGLMAYWVFQHVGNLSPADARARASLLDEVRACRGRRRAARVADGHRGPPDRPQPLELRARPRRRAARRDRLARRSRRHAGTARARSRTRSGPGSASRRRSRRATCCWPARCRSCSRPGLHHVEAFDEALTDGAWGRVGGVRRRAAAAPRRDGPLGVVPAHASDRLAELLDDVAHGRDGRGARIDRDALRRRAPLLPRRGRLPPGGGPRSPVWQAVCSAFRKELAPHERRDRSRSGTARSAERLARRLARAARRRRRCRSTGASSSGPPTPTRSRRSRSTATARTSASRRSSTAAGATRSSRWRSRAS